MGTRACGWIAAVALALSGCAADGEPGPAGPMGEMGTEGEVGPPGPGTVVWKDSTGATVERVISGNRLLVFDDDDNVWGLSPGTGRLSPALPGVVVATFESDDCTGQRFFRPFQADFPGARLVYSSRSEPGMFFVRDDTEQPESVTLTSFAPGPGQCDVFGVIEARAVLRAGTPVTPPTLPYSPPFHPELPAAP